MRITIIGAGNVGTNLHYALAQRHIQARLVHAREWLNDPTAHELPEADAYIYAIADYALKEVVDRVHAPKALHLHTSGTVHVNVFGPDKPHAGIIYFFQSFSKEQLIDDWSTIPVFIEGKSIDDVAAVYTLAQMLSSRIYECSQRDRERLHIAGVFANNYANLMYRMAADVLRDTQIPFEALLPLIDQTAAKVHTMRPADAQTGPAQRGDEEVIKHHLQVLAAGNRLQTEVFSAEEVSSVYQELAALIAKGRNHPNQPNE